MLEEALKSIEDSRTIIELGDYLGKIYSIIESDVELIRKSRFKVKRLKEYWEELVPLYIYTKNTKPESDSKYKIVVGSQQYDALEINGSMERKIEFTECIDGYVWHKYMEDINEYGVTRIKIEDVEEEKKRFINRFHELAEKKHSKLYKETDIIFMVSYSSLDFIFTDEEEFLQELLQILKKMNFGSSQTFLMLRKGHFSEDENKVYKARD